MADWMRQLSVDEAYRLLVDGDVPAAPVRTIDSVADDPQIQHRPVSQDVRNPDTGVEMRLSGNPIKLVGMPDRSTRRRRVPTIATDGEWLGLDETVSSHLELRKVI